MRSIFFLFCVTLFQNFSLEARFILGESAIHVFGESHAEVFNSFGNELSIFVHHLPAITMHRIGRDGLRLINFKEHGIKEHDVVVFVSGEVDVRCHIGKQRDLLGRKLDEIIDTLAKNYFSTILANKSMYQDVLCIVYCVVPPCDRVYNASFPFYGTLEDRVDISLRLNKKLFQYGEKYGIQTLDVFNFYCDSRGMLRSDISDGGIHIGTVYTQPIKEKLLDILERSL